MAYVGETKRMLLFRLADHCGYVLNEHLHKATVSRFNLPGHSLVKETNVCIEEKENSFT